MQKEVWLERWANNETGFHDSKTNALLLKHFNTLELPLASCVFVPMCGKSLDIGWLLTKGYCVVGVELSEIAVKELFSQLGEEPHIMKNGKHIHYHAENIDIYVGDFFELTTDIVGNIDAVYDRASIVAMPKEMRIDYAKKMLELSKNAPQLLVSIEYDQSLSSRSPFSVNETEIKAHYSKAHEITLLERIELEGGFKGKIPARDSVWLLERKMT